MSDTDKPFDELVSSLQERAKELSCLYEVEEVLRQTDQSLAQMSEKIVSSLAAGMFYAEAAQARIVVENQVFQTQGFQDSPWKLTADLIVQNDRLGWIEVGYPREMPALDDGPFLREEKRLIDTVAQRLGQTILHKQLESLFRDMRTDQKDKEIERHNWQVVYEMLKLTDRDLLLKISRRMLNYLCYIGVEEARQLLGKLGWNFTETRGETQHDGVNQPIRIQPVEINLQLAEQIFVIAARRLSNDMIFAYFQKWIKENKVSFLLDVLEDNTSKLSDIAEAIVRFRESGFQESDLSRATIDAVHVSLIRRLFSRRLEFINIAKKHITLDTLYDLTQRFIYPPQSNGKLGGKAAGMSVAREIIRKNGDRLQALRQMKVPRTWYIPSDGIFDFLHHNHLEDLLEYKYHEIDQIRLEYPNLIQLFKNSSFSPEMIKGLAMALDDLGDRPLIVRSSSLLEDSQGAAFSGKYKSLFIANQGTKQERMQSLLDAIAEVYASTFGPDPIEYRAERGLLDFPEEMGIIIQEVVGDRVGPYLCPAFAGVAFSHNEFRWSPRIRRDDGLARLVPGLGTRAVDRVSNDYPVLVAPGQPGLRVNASIEETMQYAPRFVDAINLVTRSIETVPLAELLRAHGGEYPRAKQIFSELKNNLLQPATGLIDFEGAELVATFDGLVTRTSFIAELKILMDLLAHELGSPVDIEFAADAKDYYLLQCRAQSSLKHRLKVTLPHNIAAERLVFTADKYISDGFIPDITHIVYVDPEAYEALHNIEEMKAVGRAVGKLNTLLSKRRFILMGPGRWGSRGDVKLGVSVGYSDINNTAALIEIAFKKGDYLPDLSFGTHFFQDLVEASISYLPLYPDDPTVVFNRKFLLGGPNRLAEMLPEFNRLAHVLHVIDVPHSAGGQTMQLLMSGEEGKAIGMLGTLSGSSEYVLPEPSEDREEGGRDQYWMWRLRMAEKIAATLDGAHFGVKAIYVFGSTKTATARPDSDIDLLLHVDANEQQMKALKAWLEGWSLCLGEINYLRTGHQTDRLLDLYFITDEDIRNEQTLALKINPRSDAVKPLPLLTRKE